MRAVFLLLVMMVSGCGRLIVPSELRPVPHPLLELGPRVSVTAGYAARAEAPVAQSTPARSTVTQPTSAQPRSAQASVAPASPLVPRKRATKVDDQTKEHPQTKRRGVTSVQPLPARSAKHQPAAQTTAKKRGQEAERAVAHRRAIRRQLDTLIGERHLGPGPLTELALIRSTYQSGAMAKVKSTDAVWQNSAPISRSAKLGDLMFFQPAPDVPRVCVVRRKLRGGVIEAACTTRGAVRLVRISAEHPNTRRRQGRIINTFLRRRRRTDPARARYLAGQLLWQIRTPFAD